MSVTRPPMFAGPIERHRKAPSVTESSGWVSCAPDVPATRSVARKKRNSLRIVGKNWVQRIEARMMYVRTRECQSAELGISRNTDDTDGHGCHRASRTTLRPHRLEFTRKT